MQAAIPDAVCLLKCQSRRSVPALTFLLVWLQELLDLVDWIQVTLEDDVEVLADSSSDKQYSYLSRMFRWLKRLLPNLVDEPYTADSMVGSCVHQTTPTCLGKALAAVCSCLLHQGLPPRRGCMTTIELRGSADLQSKTIHRHWESRQSSVLD